MKFVFIFEEIDEVAWPVNERVCLYFHLYDTSLIFSFIRHFL